MGISCTVLGMLFPKLGRRGVAALEFAIVGPLALFLLLNTFLCAVLYFYQFGLTAAAEYASRQIVTGQTAYNQAASGSKTPLDTFRKDLCDNGLPQFMACGRLIINVRHAQNGTSANFTQNISTPVSQLDIGGAGDFVFVTLYYQVGIPLFYPLFNQKMQEYFLEGLGFTGDGNGSAIIISTVSAKSELY